MQPDFRFQRVRVYELLNSNNPDGMTRMQIAESLGIERASICRRVAELRDKGMLWVVRKGIDPITGARAEFLTTNRGVAMNIKVPQVEKSGNIW